MRMSQRGWCVVAMSWLAASTASAQATYFDPIGAALANMSRQTQPRQEAQPATASSVADAHAAAPSTANVAVPERAIEPLSLTRVAWMEEPIAVQLAPRVPSEWRVDGGTVMAVAAADGPTAQGPVVRPRMSRMATASTALPRSPRTTAPRELRPVMEAAPMPVNPATGPAAATSVPQGAPASLPASTPIRAAQEVPVAAAASALAPPMARMAGAGTPPARRSVPESLGDTPRARQIPPPHTNPIATPTTIVTAPRDTSAPKPEVPAKAAVDFAPVEVRPSPEAIALVQAQHTISSLQHDLASNQAQLRTATVERDQARAQLVVAQAGERTARAQVDNQRGLTAIALHQTDRAVQAFAAAAAQGDTNAMANWGLLLLNGQDVPRDVPRAIGLLERAAGQGNLTAARNLASIYARGIGVPTDAVRAAHWQAQAQRLAQVGEGVADTVGTTRMAQ